MQQSLKQTLEHKLVMNQMLRQAIDLLTLSNIELVQKIQQEILENPILEEIQQDTKNISLEQFENKPESTEDYLYDPIAWKEYIEDDYKHSDYEVKEKANYEDFIAKKISLSEHLLWQLSMSKLPYHEYKIGELIIGNLDNNGYFIGKTEELAQLLHISSLNIEKVLRIIQRFDPIGVGAKNVLECLIIQAQELYPQDKILPKIIEYYFEDLAEKRFSDISQKMNIPVETVEKYFELIKTFEPKPGRQYFKEQNKYIVPDVIIEKIDDNYVVTINDEYLPRLSINQYYSKILKKTASKEVKKYLRQKMESASWLLNSIDQRRNTIYKVVTKIVEIQKEFFDKGIMFLKPLSLSDIANEISMHESTVSRTTTNKYAETPLGIFELKYFFVRGIENALGEDISIIKVKNKIETILENENKEKPISDQKIAEILTKEGLTIARRTVAKYREDMNIPSSSKRKNTNQEKSVNHET
ncbi:MAG: RNA polymerase factor sigma-54 [Candidatus Firestonebacteria bacterium]|nr:RNA polymerase factor sigma-54 [Candidatus Firestonebacteria bacterium]